MNAQTPVMPRRRFIAILGGGLILAAGSAFAGFALTRTPHQALAAWDEAGQYNEPRRFALSYAILAPNPHNLQPWQVDLSEPDVVTVLDDVGRSRRDGADVGPFGVCCSSSTHPTLEPE